MNINKEDLMIHTLNNLPREFETTVEVLERAIDDYISPLTIKTFRDESKLKLKKGSKQKRIC